MTYGIRCTWSPKIRRILFFIFVSLTIITVHPNEPTSFLFSGGFILPPRPVVTWPEEFNLPSHVTIHTLEHMC